MSRNGLILALALGSLSIPAQAANVLVNPGFETGSLTPWTAESSPTVTSAQAHTGTYSVAAFSSDAIRQNFAPIATSQISQVSFWVLREGGPFDLYTFFYDDLTSADFLVNGLGGSQGWQFFDVTANLAAGKNLIGLRIYGTSPGPGYFDDFIINVAGVPEPSTWGMMLLGFAGIGLALRFRRRPALA